MSSREISVQVHVVETELFQARPDRSRNVFDVRDHLCRHEQFAPLHLALLDRRPELGLGFVNFSSVLVVVSEAQRKFDRVDAGLVDLGLVAGLVPGGPRAVAELA